MLLVYVTTKDDSEAKKIANHAVEQRLAAGVNIFPSIQSVYHWQGEIVHNEECVCIFKTTQEKFSALRDAIVRLHSYDTPCVVAVPTVAAHEPFVAWAYKECRCAFPSPS